jgi:hypothetical protein
MPTRNEGIGLPHLNDSPHTRVLGQSSHRVPSRWGTGSRLFGPSEGPPVQGFCPGVGVRSGAVGEIFIARQRAAYVSGWLAHVE